MKWVISKKKKVLKKTSSRLRKMSSTRISSLFLPRVGYPQITEERIMKTFEKAKIAKIASIDLVPVPSNGKGQQFNRAFVHIAYWYDGKQSEKFQKAIENEETTKLFYENEYYWHVLKNKSVEMPEKIATEGILPIPEDKLQHLQKALEIQVYDENGSEQLESGIKLCHGALNMLMEMATKIKNNLKNLEKTKDNLIEEISRENSTPSESLLSRDDTPFVLNTPICSPVPFEAPNAPMKKQNIIIHAKNFVPRKLTFLELLESNNEKEYPYALSRSSSPLPLSRSSTPMENERAQTPIQKISLEDEMLLMNHGIVINHSFDD